jgi:hypothetical protein
MNTFALVYTLRTQDMWVTHFSPKGAALTRFFIYFFVLDHFDQTVRRTSKYLLILYFSVLISDYFNSIVRRKVSISLFYLFFLF